MVGDGGRWLLDLVECLLRLLGGLQSLLELLVLALELLVDALDRVLELALLAKVEEEGLIERDLHARREMEGDGGRWREMEGDEGKWRGDGREVEGDGGEAVGEGGRRWEKIVLSSATCVDSFSAVSDEILRSMPPC